MPGSCVCCLLSLRPRSRSSFLGHGVTATWGERILPRLKLCGGRLLCPLSPPGSPAHGRRSELCSTSKSRSTADYFRILIELLRVCLISHNLVGYAMVGVMEVQSMTCAPRKPGFRFQSDHSVSGQLWDSHSNFQASGSLTRKEDAS